MRPGNAYRDGRRFTHGTRQKKHLTLVSNANKWADKKENSIQFGYCNADEMRAKPWTCS
ncbi:hypothetical protein BDR04DRAFT_1109097 [Suillus decipiens]|nr:hypothetical protein BDR04DRAFT_1109097 [Suillus decipiens]